MFIKRICCFIFLNITLIFCFSNEIKNISRIVSLSPAATEIIFMLEGENKLVGRTDFCDYPPEVLKIESCGGFDGKSLSIEKIISLQPDLVILVKGMHDHLIKPLNKFRIETYVSNVESFDDMFEEIKIISKYIKKEILAENYIFEMEKTILEIRNNLKKKNCEKLRLFWLVDSVPYVSVGKKSFINDLIVNLGCENIFSEIDNPYPIVSEEIIIAKNPQVIIVPVYSEERPMFPSVWKHISAIKNNFIIYVDADLASRSSPRIIQCMEFISEKIINHF